MSRLLFFAALVAAVYLLLKSYRGRGAEKETRGQAEDMVRCVYCGVHIPKSESIMADGKYYCCDAHRRAYQPPSRGPDAG
jgi:uncharacterized protein